ncbi:hypothetical protein, conserved [Leishmania tarentolae]|uniref:Uncharacterized protein n=1 Tax=Leishmania tarentolae TaxID=5689 RepID=A0A640K8T2_LEITA|nr:hypothetical protein, conserved [Leishmania tarentolae]
MAPLTRRGFGVSAPSAMPLPSSAAEKASCMLLCILLLVTCHAAPAASLTGDECIHHGRASDKSGAAVHHIDSSVGDTAAPGTTLHTGGAASAPLRRAAGATHAAGLLKCQELYAQSAASSSLLLSGDCVLPRISKQLSGVRKDDLLQQASSPEAETRIFTWQIGPRTPKHQAPLQTAFSSYFMNVSGAVGGVQGELQMESETAWRVHKYNALYAREGRSTAGVRNGGQDGSAHAGERGDGTSSWSFTNCVRAVVEPLVNVVAAFVDVSGLGSLARYTITEVIANLRVFSWCDVTAWSQLFMRRQVTLRIHIGSWSGSAAAAAAAASVAEEDDNRGGVGGSVAAHVMLSRMAMSTHGAVSLLRVISFPPVVQLVPERPAATASAKSSAQTAATSLVCSLPAVQAASLLLQEDAMARRREAQQTAAAAGVAAFPRGWRQRVRSGLPPNSEPWMVSIVRGVIGLVTRLLLGTSREDDAAAAWSRAASISPDDGVSRSAAVAATRGFLARVREELGPHQAFSESVLPMALQEMLGSRTMQTHAQLVENKVLVAGEPRKSFDMQWEASLPAAKPMCLALVALPPSSFEMETTAGVLAQSTAAGDHLPVSLEEVCSFDTVWLQLLIMAWVVWQLERHVAQNALVNRLVTGLSGILLLLLVLLWYAIRRLQGSSLQLIMLAMALLLGGSTVMMDGLLSIVQHLHYMIGALSEHASGSARGQWAGAEGGSDADGDASSSALSVFVVLGSGLLVIMCIGSGILLNWLVPPAVLRAITFSVVRGLLLMLWGLCATRNTEATAVALLLWALWRARSILRVTPSFSSPAELGKSVAFSVNDPLEEVPLDARQARGYVRPLAVSSWATTSGRRSAGYASLNSSASRLKRYEEEGTECTRRALEELAAHLRANPGRYAMRLRDPNGVQCWAGTTSTETDEDAEEEVVAAAQ